MKALILALALFWSFGTQYETTFKIKYADYVERRVIGMDVVPQEFYFSFSSLYQINGVQVQPNAFWSHADIGEQLQVKAQLRKGFWFVSRVNLREKN